MTTLLPAQGAPAPPSVCAGELPGVPLHPRPPRLRLHPHRPRRHPARARPPPPPPRAPCPRLPNVRPVGCRARINSPPLLCHLPPFRSTRSARPESLHSSPHIYTAPPTPLNICPPLRPSPAPYPPIPPRLAPRLGPRIRVQHIPAQPGPTRAPTPPAPLFHPRLCPTRPYPAPRGATLRPVPLHARSTAAPASWSPRDSPVLFFTLPLIQPTHPPIPLPPRSPGPAPGAARRSLRGAGHVPPGVLYGQRPPAEPGPPGERET